MNAFDLFTPDLSERVCLTLLHSLWQVTCLAALAWLVGRYVCRRSVEWQYTLHVGALVASCVCVLATFLFFTRSETPSDVARSLPASQPPALAAEREETAIPASLPAVIEVSASIPHSLSAEEVTTQSAVTTLPTTTERSWVEGWEAAAPWLVGAYVVGVGMMLVRLAAAIAWSERIRSQCRVVSEGPLYEALQRLADAWSLRVVPALATAENVVVPKVVGLLKPTILIPGALVSGLSPHELELILAHELAHVRRHDMWINLAQRLAEAVLFFNPALWVLSHRISTLREYCCDEMACRRSDASGETCELVYAQALLRVVELTRTVTDKRSELASLAASGRSPSELRRRVARLFGEPIRESLQLSRGALLPLSIAAALLLVQPVFTTLAEDPQPTAEVAEKETDSEAPFQLSVIDPEGKPVANVEVEVRLRNVAKIEEVVTGKFAHEGNYGTFVTTDDQGKLAIRFRKTPKFLAYSVKQPGYAPYWAEWDSTDHPEPIPRAFTMQLDPGWTVGGIVQDEAGNPITGATVRPSIFFKMRPGVTRQLGIGTRLKTKEDGSWQFESVPGSKDDLTVELMHPDFQPMWHTVPRDGYEIKPGVPLGTITLKKGLEVTGTITDASGAPIEGALVRTKFTNDIRKATTDAQGKYVLKGCQPRMARIVVSAKGKALDMHEVLVDPEMKPVDFTMQPGGKVRVRVVDENGKGIPKARIFFQRWDGKRIEYFEFDHISQYADENGVWEWNEAPLEPFQADICRPDGMQLLQQTLVNREEEFVFSPPPALVVSGKVIDAKTKQPIPKFRVIPGLRNSDPRLGIDWNQRDGYDAKNGEYKLRFTRDYPSHLIRIEADGYQVAISHDLQSNQGNMIVDFALQPAPDIAATIVGADGQPAAGAKIALGVAGDQISINNGDIDNGSTYATRIDADAEGRFRLPSQIEAYQLVITHEAGFFHFKSEEGAFPDPVRLTPWAKLEGTFRVGADVAPNVNLDLGVETIRSYGDDVPNIFTHYNVTTGADGTFGFDRVLPGTGYIGRRIMLLVREGATEATSSVRVFTEFKSGETTKLDLGGTGRAVVGKLTPPPGFKDRVFWNFAMITVRADLEAPQRPPYPAEIQNKPQEHQAWWNGWKQTREGQAWLEAYRAYERERSMSPYITASIDRDGTFRIDDVPPGDYVMSIRFDERSPGSLSNYKLHVPPIAGVRSDDAVDLGTITLQPR